MKAAIVTIGDEILIGQIIDTNSSYMAKALDKIGIATYEMVSISDEKSHILQTLQEVQNNFDVVLITGGLGPTKDDITKKTFCDYFDYRKCLYYSSFFRKRNSCRQNVSRRSGSDYCFIFDDYFDCHFW